MTDREFYTYIEGRLGDKSYDATIELTAQTTRRLLEEAIGFADRNHHAIAYLRDRLTNINDRDTIWVATWAVHAAWFTLGARCGW